MKAAMLYGYHDVRVEQLPDPAILKPTDAIVEVMLACVCGSDLWGYRAEGSLEQPYRGGHEFLGVVSEIGSEVHTVKPGQIVIAPFVWSDGTCVHCRNGLQTSCLNGGGWGEPDVDGGQGEIVRVPYADGTLVAAPVDASDERLPALLTLSDVLGTGHHAAISAGVGAGTSVTIVGDGAVGLCATLASRRLGAERIIVMSRNPERAALARLFGATDVIGERGESAISGVHELTDGLGTDYALECVGTDLSWQTALGAVRDGGRIGHVGVPAGVSDWLKPRQLFSRNVGIGGGVAPVRAYLPELLIDVLAGTLDASPVFDLTVDIDHIPDGYAAMDERRAVKVLIRQ